MELLWLIAAGIESRVRGTLSYLMRQGRSLLAPSTLEEATARVSQVMNIQTQIERDLIHQIATEQAQVIDFSRRLQSGQVVGNLSQIPAVSTFTGQPNENVRYLVVVRFNDPLTGERRDYPVEIYSDVPILKDDVLAQAIRDAESRIVPLGPPTTPVPEGPIRVTSATIISASKRA